MTRRDSFAVLGILLFAVVWFTGIESLFPRYFLWDDNAAFFLPSILFNEETLRTEHVVPIINFFQFAGWNHLDAVHNGVLYPPNYLAAWIAGNIFHSPLWTIDIIAALHMISGMLGMYAWLRLLKTSPRYAAAGALLYLTLPFSTILARSWIFVAYAHCFIPLCFALLEWNAQRTSALRNAFYIIVKSLFVFCGYIQYVVYLSVFELLYCFLRSKSIDWKIQSWRVLLTYAAMNIMICILSLPLLLPMAEATLLSAARSSPLPLFEALNGSIDPVQTLLAQFYIFYGGHLFVESSRMMFLGGSILLFTWGIFRTHPLPRYIRTMVILFIAALALSTPLHFFLSIFPIINRFRWPFKMFLFAGFFFVTACAQALSDTEKNRKIGKLPLLLLCFFSILSQALMVSTRPYSAYTLQSVHNPFANQQGNFRTASTGTLSMRSLPKYMETFPAYNVPTLWKLPILGGYDPLVSRTHKTISSSSHNSGIIDRDHLAELAMHLSQWSVRYLVSAGPLPEEIIKKMMLRRTSSVGPAIVYENPDAYPIAAFTETPRSALNITYHANRLRISSTGQTGKILLRMAPITGYWLLLPDGKQRPAQTTASGLLLSVDHPEVFVDVLYRSKAFEWGWMGAAVGITAASMAYVGRQTIRRYRR